MQKIKTVFVVDRSQRPHRITDQIQVEWVISGDGVATIKYDGTACLIDDGRLFRRYDAKPGRTPPEGFFACQENPDPVSGHFPGWIPVTDGPADRFHKEAFDQSLADGTYELLGPKIQGNRYGLARHELRRHGADIVEVTRSFEGIRDWLEVARHEGLVFHNSAGRMAKIRRKDFGFKW